MTLMRTATYRVARMNTDRVLSRAVWLGLAAFLAAGAVAVAQQDELESPPEKRKQPGRGWFLRPARDNSADQRAYADRLRAEGHRKARRQYRALVAWWPDAPEAPAAQYAIGRILEERGRIEEAFDEYQYLVDRYAGRFAQYDEVLERQFGIARRLMDEKKGRFLFFDGFSAPERAIPLFEHIVLNGPSWEKAAEAQYLAGRARELTDDLELAIVDYMKVQHRYPESPFAEQSAFRRATCVYLLAKESPNSEEFNDQAWAALTLFLNGYPASEHAGLAGEYRKTIFRNKARLEYEKAHYYDRVARNPQAALMAYRTFIKSYPNSEWTGIAEIRIEELGRIAAALEQAAGPDPEGQERAASDVDQIYEE